MPGISSPMGVAAGRFSQILQPQGQNPAASPAQPNLSHATAKGAGMNVTPAAQAGAQTPTNDPNSPMAMYQRSQQPPAQQSQPPAATSPTAPGAAAPGTSMPGAGQPLSGASSQPQPRPRDSQDAHQEADLLDMLEAAKQPEDPRKYLTSQNMAAAAELGVSKMGADSWVKYLPKGFNEDEHDVNEIDDHYRAAQNAEAKAKGLPPIRNVPLSKLSKAEKADIGYKTAGDASPLASAFLTRCKRDRVPALLMPQFITRIGEKYGADLAAELRNGWEKRAAAPGAPPSAPEYAEAFTPEAMAKLHPPKPAPPPMQLPNPNPLNPSPPGQLRTLPAKPGDQGRLRTLPAFPPKPGEQSQVQPMATAPTQPGRPRYAANEPGFVARPNPNPSDRPGSWWQPEWLNSEGKKWDIQNTVKDQAWLQGQKAQELIKSQGQAAQDKIQAGIDKTKPITDLFDTTDAENPQLTAKGTEFMKNQMSKITGGGGGLMGGLGGLTEALGGITSWMDEPLKAMGMNVDKMTPWHKLLLMIGGPMVLGGLGAGGGGGWGTAGLGALALGYGLSGGMGGQKAAPAQTPAPGAAGPQTKPVAPVLPAKNEHDAVANAPAPEATNPNQAGPAQPNQPK